MFRVKPLESWVLGRVVSDLGKICANTDITSKITKTLPISTKEQRGKPDIVLVFIKASQYPEISKKYENL